MKDIYQGDPKLFIDAEGVDFNIPGESLQPEMEQGVENLTFISLLTDKGWPGNFYLTDNDQKIGSKFEETFKLPITLSNLEVMRKATIEALKNPIFGKIESTVTAPQNNRLKNVIEVAPPGGELFEIVLIKNGLNWLLQAEKGQGE